MREEDLYDLLRALVSRTSWADQAQFDRYLRLVDRLEEANVFGTVAVKIKEHD